MTRGVCMAGGVGGMCGRGACMAGRAWWGACMAGGVHGWRGMHGRGACVAGGGHAWPWGCAMAGAT